MAQIVGPVIIVLFFLFGGLFLNLDSVPAVFKWIQWISIIAYTNKALNQNQFKGLVFNCDGSTPGCYKTGEQFLDVFKLTNPDMWYCVIVNVGLGLAFILIGYLLFLRTSAPLMRLK